VVGGALIEEITGEVEKKIGRKERSLEVGLKKRI